jgi:hypothetical protein
VVYIDLHVENVGWSSIDNCWKIFDFNMSGLLQSPISGVCINDWQIEPQNSIIFKKIKQLNLDYDKIMYDEKAKDYFNDEKKSVETTTRCIECDKTKRSSVITNYDKGVINCKKCREGREAAVKTKRKPRHNLTNNSKRKNHSLAARTKSKGRGLATRTKSKGRGLATKTRRNGTVA